MHLARVLPTLLMIVGTPAMAQPGRAPVATTAAIAFLDGVWIGPAAFTGPDGKTERFEQMERVGPMMNGQVRVMEGKGRDGAGNTTFNAFTVFSTATGGGVTMRSWTMGFEGVRPLVIDAAGGFRWEMQAGPGVTIRYVATVRGGIWDEHGERVGPDGKAVRFFEMRLKRVGDTDWPAANAAFSTRP